LEKKGKYNGQEYALTQLTRELSGLDYGLFEKPLFSSFPKSKKTVFTAVCALKGASNNSIYKLPCRIQPTSH